MLSIGFVGSGNIAQALIKGWQGNEEIAQLIYSKDDTAEIAQTLKIDSRASVLELWRDSDIVILAVPKAGLFELAPQLNMAATVKPEVIVASVVDAVSLVELHQLIGPDVMIARAMPNMNVAVRAGYTGLAFDDKVVEEVRGAIAMLFTELGRVEPYDDMQLATVSAVAGAGSAFMAALADILANVALENGIDVGRAVSMAEQTLVGTAKSMHDLKQSPNTFELAVAPAGSGNAAALEQLADNGFIESVKAAVTVAQTKNQI